MNLAQQPCEVPFSYPEGANKVPPTAAIPLQSNCGFHVFLGFIFRDI